MYLISIQNTLPEGFPNSYIRGTSSLYLRAGVHVEPVNTESGTSQPKGTHLHIYAEPAIPSDGIAFGGPITLRVVENENTCREFARTLNLNGGLCQWGPIFLHSKSVTSAKAQLAAIGSMDRGGSTSTSKTGKSLAGEKSFASSKNAEGNVPTGSSVPSRAYSIFTDNIIHSGGYQALELVRLTNRTPLLWCTIDPAGLYGARIAMNQPDACWGEMLFHDVNASGQIEAIRALAERPLRIQGSVNVTSVYVSVRAH